jgi:hypothetical protein
MRKVDLFVPLLRGDPTIKAVDIVRDIVGARAANRQDMTAVPGPGPDRSRELHHIDHSCAVAPAKATRGAARTGDPTIKAVDIVRDIVGARAANRQDMTADQGLDPIIRESCITLIILVRLLHGISLGPQY